MGLGVGMSGIFMQPESRSGDFSDMGARVWVQECGCKSMSEGEDIMREVDKSRLHDLTKHTYIMKPDNYPNQVRCWCSGSRCQRGPSGPCA